MLLNVTQSGQLNEYTERKEMASEIVCMSLGSVPQGEQRSRFLAVGLSDQTVRVISLDPSVSCQHGCYGWMDGLTIVLCGLGYSAASQYAGLACRSREPVHCGDGRGWGH